MDKSEQAYRDFYHKIKASVSLDEWKTIWNFIEKRLTQPAAARAAQAQPCNHVFEARPIDGSRRAAAPVEAVCMKCGYQPRSTT